MATVDHWYKVHHGTGVSVRVLINDVLCYRHSGDDNMTVSSPANPLFVPGQNEVRIEVAPGVVPAHSPGIRGPVEAVIMVEGGVESVIAMCRWEWSNPNKEPPLPTGNVTRFLPTGDIAEPPWLHAPRERFGPEGTPGMRAAVSELHAAFSRRDVGAYMEANALKMETWQRAFPDNETYRTSYLREDLAANLQREWIVRPLDFNALIFESQADGRVAYVRRLDGGKALQAVPVHQEPGKMQLSFETDLWMTQVDGAWRVFR